MFYLQVWFEFGFKIIKSVSTNKKNYYLQNEGI